MNTDAYYEIGFSHKVCEDYALAGEYKNMAYAIVSDGCSSSDDSDVGARLMSHIAKGVLIYLRDRDIIGTEEYSNIFKELVIRKCIEVKSSLGLPTEAFDATLLINVVYNKNIISLGWGDGYFAFVTNTKNIIAYGITYSTGAPYYLSYEMSPTKKDAYKNAYGMGTMDTNSYVINMDGTVIENKIDTSPIRYSESLHRVSYSPAMDFVMVSSDGLDTYQNNPKFDRPAEEEKSEYKAENIIPLTMAYKNIVGEFVIRRMVRLKSDMNKNNILHLDDVSCATIAIDHKEPEE